jgi:hypothetical protein
MRGEREGPRRRSQGCRGVSCAFAVTSVQLQVAMGGRAMAMLVSCRWRIDHHSLLRRRETAKSQQRRNRSCVGAHPRSRDTSGSIKRSRHNQHAKRRATGDGCDPQLITPNSRSGWRLPRFFP